jgi:excisionase family DNA binding protein
MKKTLGERLEKAFYTIDEVAEFLRMDPGTLRNKRSKGQAPKATKIGGRVLFEAQDVKEYIEERDAA